MPRTLRALFAAAVATGAVVAGAVLSRPADTGAEAPAYESTPLTAYDTTTVSLERGAFCAAVPAEAVTEALGDEPRAVSEHGNGERARITGELRDVAHEYSCTWKASAATARAWLFAPPVTARRAQELIDAARATGGCEAIADAPDFGAPSYASVCGSAAATTRAAYRGLFGDAWLTCELAADGLTRAQLLDRTGRWCVAVAEAARTR